ncbi:hypothetical protein KY341_01890 [Candidatus Woesearchaeota archaeon]|nr:hypothetical protein [Candidatus Woesearchaeota archaeon]
MPSIIELPETISELSDEGKALFNRFFDIRGSIGKMVIPEEMKPWIEKTFGGVASVEQQKIIKIFNKVTFESAMFNELRAKRPIEAKTDDSVTKEINESAGDPFCKPLSMTPADSFGRIKGKFCITASNVAKYDGLHGLVIFNKHNPLDFTEKEVQDYFHTSLKWFDKAHKSNKEAAYPFLLWNCLWRAAASIIHGHFQLVLGEGKHYAEAEEYNETRKRYYNEYKSDYFFDFYKLHELIGLGLERKNLRVFTNIAPRKDKEITIISEKPDNNFISAVYKAANCLVKDFGVMSFNIGIIFPPLNKDEGWEDFPVIARIVDRGKLSNKTVDVGGMEMYARSNVIETDPYKVFEKIKSYF